MKLIIAGTRDLDISQLKLGSIVFGLGIRPTEIVSGVSGNVDLLGESFADDGRSMMKLSRFPADWNKHGKAAGPIRNREMAEYADVLLLIWDGQSKGSLSMRNEMRNIGKPVYEVVLPTPNKGSEG